MGKELQSMMRGLTLHFLHRKTVAEAIREGREAGVPEELLESLPGMMFEITSAACAVHAGARPMRSVVSQMVKKSIADGGGGDLSRDDAKRMIEMTVAFIRELSREAGENDSLPGLTVPWYRYGTAEPTSRQS